MEYITINTDKISQVISEMVRGEIEKTVRAQVRRHTPKQYEIKEMLKDIIHEEIGSMLFDEVEKFKADVLGPKVSKDMQEIIDREDILKKATISVPHIVADKMKGFEDAVFEKIMNSRFKDPEKPIAYEFHQLMAKYITRVYEKSTAKPDDTV